MKKVLIIISFCTLFVACKAYKKDIIQSGGFEEAISNAILDFSNTSRLYSKNNVFRVTIHNPLHKMVLDSTEEGNGWSKGE